MKTIAATLAAMTIGIAAFIAASIWLNGGTFGKRCAQFHGPEYQDCLRVLSQGGTKL